MRDIRLRKRLERLETTMVANLGWEVSSVDVHQAALAELSPADRGLIEGVLVREPAKFGEGERATWNRWGAALAEAIRETGFPIFIRAEDWFL
jgi:hypothetical protein